MAYGEFYVEHQGWARWPKTLIMCRKRGYEIIERRRYVQERTCKLIRNGSLANMPSFVCWSCSECGFGWHHSENDKQFSFCPNCGAKVVSE